MRGILGLVVPKVSDSGITPAHAGNTKIAKLYPAIQEDHPRACGEYLSANRPVFADTGSPPRMRGILRQKRPLLCVHGITPAHAGNT